MKIDNAAIQKIVQEEINKFLYNQEFLDIWEKNSNRFLVSEGITMTYDPKRVMRIINRKFNLNSNGIRLRFFSRSNENHSISNNPHKQSDNEIFKTEDYNKLIEICLDFKPKGITDWKFIDDIIYTMDSCGWIMVQVVNDWSLNIFKSIKEIKKDDIASHTIYFRPRLDQTVNPNNLPSRCYHICPQRVLGKILRKGLIPHDFGRNSNHPSRVYLYWDYPRDWKIIADRFRESRKDEKYALLSVNINNLKDKIRFRFDSLTMTEHPAIYTEEPIPNNCITLIDQEEDATDCQEE